MSDNKKSEKSAIHSITGRSPESWPLGSSLKDIETRSATIQKEISDANKTCSKTFKVK